MENNWNNEKMKVVEIKYFGEVSDFDVYQDNQEIGTIRPETMAEMVNIIHALEAGRFPFEECWLASDGSLLPLPIKRDKVRYG